uniref:HSB-like chaperone-like protein n=1 Tax=Antonospora locustae TaxID=278021 RepID=Q6E6H0_ANTLO|nr:HSB-like chaperone-like protein [Antonospora locustae]|eukprot:jgi/Antlo1/258/2191
MLQKPSFFSLFGMSPVFHIDKDALKRTYHVLCRQHHPDVTKTESRLAEINEAYRTLENDLRRAEYMNAAPIPRLDEKFLVEIMEYEDQIHGLGSARALEKLRAELDRRVRECYQNYMKPECLAKWRYFERLIEMLNKKEETLELH